MRRDQDKTEQEKTKQEQARQNKGQTGKHTKLLDSLYHAVDLNILALFLNTSHTLKCRDSFTQ